MALSQAEKIIQRFGGISAMSRATGVPKSTIQRWKTSGCIHPRHNPVIMGSAKSAQIQLTSDDFSTAAEGAVGAE